MLESNDLVEAPLFTLVDGKTVEGIEVIKDSR